MPNERKYNNGGNETFCEGWQGNLWIQVFETPTQDNIERQFKINEARRFLGVFASLDCMYYQWKICPIVWQGQFQNKDGNRSIIFEVVAN